MKKIEAFIRHEAFEPIRMELLEKGFPSLSIAQYRGSGRQKGITEHYRGSELTIHLRPKMKLEIVVDDKDVGHRQGSDPQARPHGRGRRREDLHPARSRRRSGSGRASRARRCSSRTRRARSRPGV